MVTQESLQEKYSEYSNVDLLEIVSNKEGYTELAISVAKKEIVKRKLPYEVLKNYKSVYSLVFDDNVENWFVDLHLWEKILLYLIWVPRL